VEDGVDVDLGRLGPVVADRVVGAHRLVLVGHRPERLPGEAGVDRQLGPARRGQQQVEELVGPERLEGREVAAAERDPADVGRDLGGADHLGHVGPQGGDLVGPGPAHGADTASASWST
jgi:hypothetical protein